MIGYVTGFRRSRHIQYNNQIIVKFDGYNNRKEASKLLGKKIVWITPFKKKIYIGRIVAPHGNKGQVRVRFKKGLPGYILGDVVYLLDKESRINELKEKLKNAKDPNQVRSLALKVFSK